MNDSLISVIVPIYNVDRCLRKCIDSIINQTYTNLEIILVDDGSTDMSSIICDEYQKLDCRVLVIHKKNEGLSDARNTGLNIARGSLIGFVDGDDYLESTMYEELKKNMDIYNSDIAICDYFKIKNGKKIYDNKYNNHEYSFCGKKKYSNIFYSYNCISTVAWNKLYKKSLFDDIRYPSDKINEDSYIICDLFDKADKISYIIKPLYNYVYRKDSISNIFSTSHFDKIDAYNKKISFYHQKEYYDIELKEKNNKMSDLIKLLVKSKKYKIKNSQTKKKYYNELVEINKEVKWKEANKINKFYKICRRPSISILAFGLKIKDLIS